MSIIINSNNITIQTRSGNEHPIPKDMWSVIFSFISPRSELRHLVSASQTCKAFHFLFQNKFPFLKGISNLCRFSQNAKEIAATQKGTLGIVGGDKNGSLLFKADDGEGRQYYTWRNTPTSVFILEFSRLTGCFAVKTVDVAEALEKDPSVDKSFKDFFINAIHPSKKGFAVVTNTGAGIWKYENETAKYQGFYSPFTSASSSNMVSSSACVNEVLYLHYSDFDPRTQAYHDFLACAVDLEESSLKTTPLEISGVRAYHVHSFRGTKDKLYLLKENYSSNGNEFTELTHEGTQLFAKKDAVIIPGNMSIYELINSTSWPFILHDKDLQVLDFETFNIVFPSRWKILCPNSHQVYGIKDDFLFITYIPDTFNEQSKITRLGLCQNLDFKVIYLPEKKDLTEKVRPLILQYLEKGDHYLFSLGFSMDSQRKSFLTILFLVCPGRNLGQKNEAYFLEVKYSLDEPTIEKPQHKELPEQKAESLIQHKSAPQPPTKTTSAKVILLAAAFFAVASVVFYFTLRSLQPGSVVYLGKGILLSGAELAALSSGTVAFLMLAIGSYRWWKARQSSRH